MNVFETILTIITCGCGLIVLVALVVSAISSILDPEEEGKLKLVKSNNPLVIDDAGVLWYCKDNSICTADIPEGVTEIRNGAFFWCSDLTAVKLPGSIVKIGDKAFEGCDSLENIVFPESLEEIGESAFEGCESLECVTIPKNVKKIGRRAFSLCNKLENVVINSEYITQKASKSKKYLTERF